MYVNPELKRVYEAIFYKQIQIYSQKKEFREHFLKVDDDTIMYIQWHKRRWIYNVYELEDL